jgi:hypothetical protein
VLDGQAINEPIAVSSTVSIDNSFAVEYQQRQYSRNVRGVGQSSSDLDTAFEGEHRINSTLYPEDIQQTHHSQLRGIDPSLPSYGLNIVFPELFPEIDDDLFPVT